MSNQPLETLDARLRQAGRTFPYPPTPDIAAAVLRALDRPATSRPWWQADRRLAVAAALLFVLLCGLLAVPPVRAQIVDFLQVGVIRILLGEPTPTQAVPATQDPASLPPGSLGPLSTTAAPAPPPALFPTQALLPSFLDLSGETTLEGARRQSTFPIRLPTHPPDLGPPDRVYYQGVSGGVVVLVWTQPGQAGHVQLSLLQFGPGESAVKSSPRFIQSTRVNGREAIWAQGEHFLTLKDGQVSAVQFVVAGNVLIWTDGEITYRLESDLALEEAVRVAESLR